MNLLALLRIFVCATSVVLSVTATTIDGADRQRDPCAVIGGKKWVSPRDVRACFKSVKVDQSVKENIIEVINKTLAFHTSVNYQIKAPEPFTQDVHENLLEDLARIQQQSYPSDYDLHIDLSRTLKRLNDGHCVWINFCYDSLFVNYLPIPLSLLTASDGSQNVHIAPEAFEVASAEFSDQIDVWQNALPEALRGKLSSLSGAKVLKINGQDPYVAVNANARITGGFQGLGTRQNAFFSSYSRNANNWTYVMGNFARQSLPLSDSVALTLELLNQTAPVNVELPYYSRFGSASVKFTDMASWRSNNCVAVNGTNGADAYASPNSSLTKSPQRLSIPTHIRPKQPFSMILDWTPPPLSSIVLPPRLQPALQSVNGSGGVSQFYMLKDGKTGVMALGLFADANYTTLVLDMLQGLESLQTLGATQLIIDLSNNGGGYVCAAQWLHRIIVGPKSTTVPKAGLDSKARAGPLAQLIVKQIVENNTDPKQLLMYNPTNWANAQNVFFSAKDDWLQPPVSLTINGRPDSFSQRLGAECPPIQPVYPTSPPPKALFDPSKIRLISNGVCASACSSFSVVMAKEDGAKTVVVGGKNDVKQEYCGTVGGQSTDYSTIDTEIKTTHLKNHSLAPPDLLVNGIQGITWRLSFGVDDPTQPEEWQDHSADFKLPLTSDLVNNPVAIWEKVAQSFFP